MLLQSQCDEIRLLPALPKAWPSGKVTGLRARGGFTVDIEWKNGKVTGYRIASAEPRMVKVASRQNEDCRVRKVVTYNHLSGMGRRRRAIASRMNNSNPGRM